MAGLTMAPQLDNVSRKPESQKIKSPESASEFNGVLDLRKLVIFSYDQDGKNGGEKHLNRLKFFAKLNEDQRENLRKIMTNVYQISSNPMIETTNQNDFKSNEEFYLPILDAIMLKSGFNSSQQINITSDMSNEVAKLSYGLDLNLYESGNNNKEILFNLYNQLPEFDFRLKKHLILREEVTTIKANQEIQISQIQKLDEKSKNTIILLEEIESEINTTEAHFIEKIQVLSDKILKISNKLKNTHDSFVTDFAKFLEKSVKILLDKKTDITTDDLENLIGKTKNYDFGNNLKNIVNVICSYIDTSKNEIDFTDQHKLFNLKIQQSQLFNNLDLDSKDLYTRIIQSQSILEKTEDKIEKNDFSELKIEFESNLETVLNSNEKLKNFNLDQIKSMCQKFPDTIVVYTSCLNQMKSDEIDQLINHPRSEYVLRFAALQLNSHIREIVDSGHKLPSLGKNLAVFKKIIDFALQDSSLRSQAPQS